MSFDPDEVGKEIRLQRHFGGASSHKQMRFCDCGRVLLPHDVYRQKSDDHTTDAVYDGKCHACVKKIIERNRIAALKEKDVDSLSPADH